MYFTIQILEGVLILKEFEIHNELKDYLYTKKIFLDEESAIEEALKNKRITVFY